MESLRVAIPKVNRETLGSFPLLIPGIEEQKEIVAHIRDHIAEIDATSTKIKEVTERLQEYRLALITEAVTGKIKVT